MSDKLKIKVNRDDDTRLWRYSSCDDFEGLREFIIKTWNVTEFIAQYEDEEGDLITIASAQDLQDAVSLALSDKRRSLKVFVLHQNRNKTPVAASNENDSNQEVEKEKKEEEEEEEEEKASSGKDRVLRFLRNEEIAGLLPELFGDIISKLIGRNRRLLKEEIAGNMVAVTKQDKFKVITGHPLYAKYSGLVIPYVAYRIEGQQALYKHFKIGTIKTWIRQLIELLIEAMSSDQWSLKHLVMIDIEYPAVTDYGKVIHYGVECDLCGQAPIIGDRYKCSICCNWDCCQQCEPKHDHPLIKFKKVSKYHRNASFGGLAEVLKQQRPLQAADVPQPAVSAADNVEIQCDCICGDQLMPTVAKHAYKRCKFVYCDGCNAEFLNETVYHCPQGNNTSHSNGYDLCLKCAAVKAELKDTEIKQEEEEEEEAMEVEAVQQPAMDREESPEVIVFEDMEQEVVASEPEQDDDGDDQEEEQEAEQAVSEQPEEEQVEQVVEEQEEEEEEEQDEVVAAEEVMAFCFQNELDQIKSILQLGDDQDDAVKLLLVENNGDVTRVVPLLLQ